MTAALPVTYYLSSLQVFRYTLIKLSPVLRFLRMMHTTKLRAGFLIAGSSGDNSKAAGESPSLQTVETFICGLKDLALFRGKQPVGIEALGCVLYLPAQVGRADRMSNKNRAFV